MIVADTSFVVAMSLREDPKHSICMSLYRQFPQIYLPQTTFAEIVYFLNKFDGKRAVLRFVELLPESHFKVEALQADDFERAKALLQQYFDTRLDFIDASVVAVAERLNIRRILTLDRRDFSLVQPSHADYLELLPTS